jgi:hypothetical protein
MAAGTTPVVTRSVTRSGTSDPPLFTEQEIFRTQTPGNPLAPRPQHLSYETTGNWSGSFVGKVSFTANTDLLFRNGATSQIRIDVRRTVDVESVHALADSILQTVRGDGGKPQGRVKNAEQVFFAYNEVTPRGTMQVVYAVMRLPSKPKDYTIVARGEWPKRLDPARRQEFMMILKTLTFE